MSQSPSPVREKQVTTLEQKRIKRKVLNVIDSSDGNYSKKLREKGELAGSVLV